MNSTNRGLNRLFILIVGLLLLAAGAGAVALATVPVVASTWRRVAGQLAGGAQPWVGQPVTGTASALVIGIAVIAVVLVLLLIAFIVKQGHGHTAAALYARSGSSTTRIDLSIPKALLQEHLQHRDELTAVQISAYEVRHTPMLKITARCRRGVSPALVAQLIGEAVGDLEQIVGSDVPTFVQLTGGFRAKSASGPRVA